MRTNGNCIIRFAVSVLVLHFPFSIHSTLSVFSCQLTITLTSVTDLHIRLRIERFISQAISLVN